MLYYRFIQFIQHLSRDNSTRQYTLGIVFGLMLGVIPALTLHWIVLLAVVFIVRINLVTTAVSSLVFYVVAALFSSTFQKFGLSLLTHSSLTSLWASLYHAPIVPFTRFNHASVMGATAFSILVCVPAYFLTFFLIEKYRSSFHKFWLSTRMHRTYAQYRRIFGNT